MFLYKASGGTYRRVITQQVHAFPFSPSGAREDEFILLSKNRIDCAMTERQVQYVAKLLKVREATGMELDAWFPDTDASSRWRYAAELYWIQPLARPFNLSEVADFNASRYATAQLFAKLDDSDELAMLHHLVATNTDLVLDVINNAERPVDNAS